MCFYGSSDCVPLRSLSIGSRTLITSIENALSYDPFDLEVIVKDWLLVSRLYPAAFTLIVYFN